jgi:general stress protein YciG
MKRVRKPEMSDQVLQFFRKTGKQGGAARAAKYSREQLAEWGRKGGRPRKGAEKGGR